MPDEVVIDGSEGEGGGQMLRTGLAFSAVTGMPLTINNIRANRPKPGLANQHLAGLKAIAKVSGAGVDGAEIGCTTVRFSPEKIRHGDYEFAVGTAGSVTLVLQTLLPALASVEGESKIIVSGGTDVKWSPPLDYYRLVLFPMLENLGLDCSLVVKKRGYFPRGGGRVIFHIKSSGGVADFDAGSSEEISQIRGMINITGLPKHIAERIENAIKNCLPERYSGNANLEIEHRENGPSQGVGVVLAAARGAGSGTVIGASSLGERGKPAEKVGKEAVNYLMNEIESGAGVDAHAADQLLPFMALAPLGGRLTARTLSDHAMTNISVIEKFLGKIFEVDGAAVRRI